MENLYLNGSVAKKIETKAKAISALKMRIASVSASSVNPIKKTQRLGVRWVLVVRVRSWVPL